MSNPNTICNSWFQNVTQLVNLLNTMNGQVLQFNSDSTIITRYFAQTNPSNPNVSIVRTDIVAADVTNSIAAFGQVNFTYNSGSPSVISELVKLLP